MSNRDFYKQAFSPLHASENISLEVKVEREKRFVPTRRVMTLCACLVLILSLGICAYATGAVQEIFGWGNNYRLSVDVYENGDTYSEGVLYTDNLTDPVEIRSGRMIFIVNDEEIDITDLVSEENAYQYEFTDNEGYTHVFLVGLLDADDINHYGYVEYIKDSDGHWIGGYSARINQEPDGSTAAEWLNLFKNEQKVPF